MYFVYMYIYIIYILYMSPFICIPFVPLGQIPFSYSITLSLHCLLS